MAPKKKPAFTAKTTELTFKNNRKSNASEGTILRKLNSVESIRLGKQSDANNRTIVKEAPIPVLVVECMHEDWITANAIYCLKRDKQWDIHLVSFNNAKSCFRYLPHLKSYRQFPEENGYEQFLYFLKNVVTETRAQVLVPTNTASCRFVIKYKEELQQFIRLMPVPNQDAYQIAGDKGLLADFMFQHHIPGPLTISDLRDNLEHKLDKFPFPVLLKPKTGSGGKGVAANEPPITLFNDKESLLACVQQHQIADRYVVQSFVEGYEIDCNALYKEGRLVAFCIQKALIKADNYAPSFGLEFIHSAEAIALVDALLSKLKWNGVAHIDLIYDTNRNELQILEINPRFWQTMVGSMMGANINFPSLACSVALDRPLEGVESKIGKYIPIVPYLKYRWKAIKSEKIQFMYKEIDIHNFFAMLPAKIVRSYRSLLLKWFRIGRTEIGEKDIMFWCVYLLSDQSYCEW